MSDLLRETLGDIAREAVPSADVADAALRLAGRRRARRRAIAPVAAVAAVTGVALAVTFAIAPARPTHEPVAPIGSPSPSASVRPAPSPVGPGSVPSKVRKLASSAPSVLTHPIARAAVMYDARDGSVILLSADDDQARRLRPASERGFHPVAFSLSPDGTKVAYGWTRDNFSSVQRGRPGTELRIVTLATGSTVEVPLVGKGLGEEVDDIQWSGDSSRLLVQGIEIYQVIPPGQSGTQSLSAIPEPSENSDASALAGQALPSDVASKLVASKLAALASEGIPTANPGPGNGSIGSGWSGRGVGFVYDLSAGAITASVPANAMAWTWSSDGSKLLEYSFDFSQQPAGLRVVDLAGNSLKRVPVTVRSGEGRLGFGGVGMVAPPQSWSRDQATAAEIFAFATPGHPLTVEDGSDRPFALRLFSLQRKDSAGDAAEVDVQLGTVNTAYLVGWVDDTHVLVATYAHDGSQTVSSVDAATGARTTVMTVSASAKAGFVQVANGILRVGGFRADGASG